MADIQPQEEPTLSLLENEILEAVEKQPYTEDQLEEMFDIKQASIVPQLEE